MSKKITVGPGDFVVVEWKDAVSLDDWTNRAELDLPPADCLSVGIVVDWKPDVGLTIAVNHDVTNDNFSCIMLIPSGMIGRVRKLRVR